MNAAAWSIDLLLGAGLRPRLRCVTRRGPSTGDTKKFLEETRSTVESHMDHAKNLMRGLAFSAAAVGGGPGSERGGEKSESMPGGVSAGKGDGGHRDHLRNDRPK